ncbi:ChbG/HpnK family deacetylase [Snodgrassella alvi]|nr:ChbG/HpnK family deacetylase [Snodgrassella alvi]
MKPVMINVDDLGLSAAVNEAVLRLAQMRRIQASSFMSLGTIAADEVAELKKQHIDIGLHFDLTGFAGLGNLKQVLIKSYLHAWSKTILQDVINRQLDAFEDKIGYKPVFIDGHQHVHQFPQIRSVLLEIILQRYGCDVAVRSTKSTQHDIKAGIIYALGGHQLDKSLEQAHITHNFAFAGIYNFNADMKILQARWKEWLGSASKQGLLIMCHPAVSSANWNDEIKSAREYEWQWLQSEAFIQCWQQHHCHAVNWQDFRQGNHCH